MQEKENIPLLSELDDAFERGEIKEEGKSYGHICTNTSVGKCTFRPYPTFLCSLCRSDGINVIYDKKDEDKIKATIKTFA